MKSRRYGHQKELFNDVVTYKAGHEVSCTQCGHVLGDHDVFSGPCMVHNCKCAGFRHTEKAVGYES